MYWDYSSLCRAVRVKGLSERGMGGGGGRGRQSPGQPSAEAFKPSTPYPVPSLEKKKQETILMTLINLILQTELSYDRTGLLNWI